MVSVLQDKILEFHPDTLEYARKDVNLDKQGRIEEAVDILDDWVNKQRHFVKKDFSRDYLERTLINAKGMVERAKQRIDKLCTFKTLMPELYPKTVAKSDYAVIDNYVRYALLPKMTKEHYRVSIFNIKSDEYTSMHVHIFYKYVIVLNEYIRIRDYNCGYVIVMDFTDVNILNFMTKCTPLELRQIITIMTEGYGMRIKQIHVISTSKMVDALLGFLKQALSSKLASRIHLHKDNETLLDFFPKEILPKEYGGEERSMQTLNDEWREAVTAKDFVDYFEEMYHAKTDESCRQATSFNEQYIGMPGSFRALSVD
uniref:CRAL-TRIO domain-containing protein n=1 Tax=Heliothis virescens TaxID=7102 RepID=A0A2A4J610_HELVI